jgi:hypothetical protein
MKNRNGQRDGILGVVAGVLLAFGGVGTGIYLGMIKPALDSGAQLVIPVRFIVVSATMLTAVGSFAIYRLSRRSRTPSRDHW